METKKLAASLSCDLDDKWAYVKTHGSAIENSSSYFDILIPRLLDIFKARNLTMTVFVVGQDAALERNKETLRSISDAGHEIGNHSYHHNPWLHRYSETEVERELTLAEECIEQATGKRAVGFRGPGYSFSIAVLRVLARRGYLYDATTLPSVLNPLSRAYYLMTSKLSKEEMRLRKRVFGSFTDGFRPNKPYQWRLENSRLTEIPVTTMPILRIPFHISYILYLAGYSRSLALRYFCTALQLCRLTRTEPSLLLHSLDFLGGEEVQDLSFFPGMTLPLQRKLELVHELLDLFCQTFTVLTIREHASLHASRGALPVIELPQSAISSNTITFA